MNIEIKQRLRWIKLYEQTGNAGLVCLRCGISRPTLRKWWRRYQQQGIPGLQSQSRRPKTSPAQKIHPQQAQWILELRQQRRLGVRRLKNELVRLYQFSVSVATLHKALKRLNQAPLRASRLLRKTRKRYERPIPGDRVQMDICQIAPGLYQYTAIDDCTRIKVLRLYPTKSAANSLDFLEQVIEEFPFPLQRLQTDRGREFFAYAFQERLMSYGIKFRPIRPRSPHLNGKVERSQRTDLEEFYSCVDLKSENLHQQLQQWQDYYNHERVHGSLKDATPWERWLSLAHTTPIWEEVEALYDPSQERFREQNYRADLQQQALKRCL
ncbi:MAG: IS481 family transposase [Chroococcidiopsidaceae cyanobacterium CP_BM_RX_35]|nr:IS481 family transposase [Chroococcidiopsidaceae cyanobacterium CP_BM_RX_35]